MKITDIEQEIGLRARSQETGLQLYYFITLVSNSLIGEI